MYLTKASLGFLRFTLVTPLQFVKQLAVEDRLIYNT